MVIIYYRLKRQELDLDFIDTFCLMIIKAFRIVIGKGMVNYYWIILVFSIISVYVI